MSLLFKGKTENCSEDALLHFGLDFMQDKAVKQFTVLNAKKDKLYNYHELLNNH